MKLDWLIRRAEEELKKRGGQIELIAILAQGLLYLVSAALIIFMVVSIATAVQLLTEKLLSSCCSIKFP
ncbi:MAG: hypothetical protein QXY49_03295 [Thermofilaceae archaeon]